MSRLDSMMRRLSAQRDGLEWGASVTKDMDGDALDMGLGNGRTYDHMREILAPRRIWVIDRILQCHPSCVPPNDDFLEGEAEDMLKQLAANKAQIVLGHYDFGFGIKEKDVAEAARLSPLIAQVMMPGGVLVSGQPLVGLHETKGPGNVDPGRYYFYHC